MDSDLSMQTHVQRSVAGCFGVLRQLRSIRRLVPRVCQCVSHIVQWCPLTRLAGILQLQSADDSTVLWLRDVVNATKARVRESWRTHKMK